MYLKRCDEEVGEIDGLLTHSSSVRTSETETESSGVEDSEDESGYEDDDNYNDEENKEVDEDDGS